MKLMPGADVWFHPGAHELQLLSDQPLAAKVTYVHHSGLVNLIVWGKGGETFQRASVPFWGDDGDRPTTNHASWISEDDFDAPDAPYVAAVARHPFEGRPSGGVEDLERARAPYDRPKREANESDDAYSARFEAWRRSRDPSVQADGQAKSNVDHGPPRSFGQSPNAGGPLAIDDHEPKPGAPATPSAPPAAFATPSRDEADKAKADKQDENKADKSSKDKPSKSKAEDAKSDG